LDVVDDSFFLTIGFGDFYPATEAGRPIFIVYALLAVPTMTIIGLHPPLSLFTNNSGNSNNKLHLLHNAKSP
jgi:hypothetical protein